MPQAEIMHVHDVQVVSSVVNHLSDVSARTSIIVYMVRLPIYGESPLGRVHVYGETPHIWGVSLYIGRLPQYGRLPIWAGVDHWWVPSTHITSEDCHSK